MEQNDPNNATESTEAANIVLLDSTASNKTRQTTVLMNKQLSVIRANANTDACSKNNLTNLLSVDSCLLPIELASTHTSKSS